MCLPLRKDEMSAPQCLMDLLDADSSSRVGVRGSPATRRLRDVRGALVELEIAPPSALSRSSETSPCIAFKNLHTLQRP